MRYIAVMSLIAALAGGAWAGPFLGASLQPAGPLLLGGWDTGPVILWAQKPISQLTSWIGDYALGLELAAPVVSTVRMGYGGMMAFQVSPPLLALEEAGPYISLIVAPIPCLVSYLRVGLYYDFSGSWAWQAELGGWLDPAGLISGGE